MPDDSTNVGNTVGGPVHEWKVKPLPPRVFTDAYLRTYYRAKRGGWFELVFTTNARYLARRIRECPPETKMHYALHPDLVEACCGLDLLPKEGE